MDRMLLRFNNGKTFIAPGQLLKAETALYFPNLAGYPLTNAWKYEDTTPILKGKVSIVSFAQHQFAEKQVESFAGEKQNPALARELDKWKDQGLQRVNINFEDDIFYATIIWFCVWLGIDTSRKRIPKEEWSRSLVVRRCFTHDIKQSIAMFNSRVGHVYLVDQDCKIRWAANGNSNPEERATIAKVVNRLMQSSLDPKEQEAARKLNTGSVSQKPAGMKRR